MSDRLDRHNERAMAANEKAWLEPPDFEDITDTQAFEDEKLAMWNERMSDPDYVLEAFGEHDTAGIEALGKLAAGNFTGTHTESIGVRVTKLIVDYCEPSDDDVIEALGDDSDRGDYERDMAEEAKYEARKEQD